MSFRSAIIGCGNISRVHAGVLDGMEDAAIVACADPVFDRAQETAAKYHCAAYASMDDLLSHERPDAVHICTPHYTHVPLILKAVEKGVPVFCEKPPVVSREQWKQLVEASKKCPIGICFQNRFNPNVVKAHELLNSGRYGTVLGVRGFMTWCRNENYYSDAWHGKWATECGGTLINQAVHTLDLILGFLGNPETVEASMANHHLRGKIEVEDTVELYLRAGNKTGLLYGSCAYTADEPVIIEIRAEKATLRLEEETLEIRSEGQVERLACPADSKLGKSYWGAGHQQCIREFYRCLRDGEPFRNNIDSCTVTADVLLKAYEQCRDKLPKME